jgi:Uma2 family endonuclease
MAERPLTILDAEPLAPMEYATNGGQALDEFVPEEVYWEKYYSAPDVNYEWNDGRLEEVPVADYAKFMMFLWFLDLLRDYLHAYPIGRIISMEVGFRLALPHKTTIRKPDLAVVLNSNPAPLGDYDRSYRGIFDLCIESVSDSSQSEVDRDAITKRDEYAAAGVQEYFVLDERAIETQFYRLNRRGIYEPLPRRNGVIGSQVLPGFQFRLKDLYAKPSVLTMMNDPVYSGYIAPHLRAERQRADEERQRADEERQRADEERQRASRAETQLQLELARAEQAEQRAARYAALLKAAGLELLN